MEKLEYDFLVPEDFMKKFSGDIFEEVCYRFLEEKYKNGWWNIDIKQNREKTLYGFIFDSIIERNAWDDFKYMCFDEKQLQIFILVSDILLNLQKTQIKIDELSEIINIPKYGYESCWNSLQNLHKLQWHHQLFCNTKKFEELNKNEIVIVDAGREKSTWQQDSIWQFSKLFLKEWKQRLLECIKNLERFNKIYDKWESVKNKVKGVPDCILFIKDKVIIYEFKLGKHPHALTKSQKLNVKDVDYEYRILNTNYNMPQKIKINEFMK